MKKKHIYADELYVRPYFFYFDDINPVYKRKERDTIPVTMNMFCVNDETVEFLLKKQTNKKNIYTVLYVCARYSQSLVTFDPYSF